jgi:hypothetical protein
MAANKILNLKTFRNLIHQLTEYGLNPSEWWVYPRKASSEVFLQHRYDSTFQLTGYFEIENSNHAYWRGLHLRSI